MPDAFIMSSEFTYYAGCGIWVANILHANNYGIGSQAHILDRVRNDYIKEGLWARDAKRDMRVAIGVVNVATGEFTIEEIKEIH